MVGILVHGNNHFILSGPVPDEAVALALRGTGQSFKSARQNLRLSVSGRFGQKNFERIWNGRWLSQVTENLLPGWCNCLESFPLVVWPSGDCAVVAGNTQREGNHALQLCGSYSDGLPQKCYSAAFPCSTSTARASVAPVRMPRLQIAALFLSSSLGRSIWTNP